MRLPTFYELFLIPNWGIVISSQLPVGNWYDAIGNPTVADAVLDRIVHSSHRVELAGESIRKMNARK